MTRKLFILAAIATASFSAVPATAVTWNYGTVHSSAAGLIPSGDAPWATLDFNQNGVNQVDFTLTHNATSASGQFLREFYMNIAPFVGATINFTDTSDANVNSASVSENAYGHATATGFDVNIKFQVSGGPGRLTAGESVSWSIVGSGLTESHFEAYSGGNAPALSLIHLQGIPGGDSSHIEASPVPEPATLSAVILGAAALLRRRRRISVV